MNAPDARRRALLRAGLAVPLLGLAGCKIPFTLEQGLYNECLAPEGQAVLRNPLIAACWDGIRADQVWDCHAHLLGNGHSKSGVWLNPALDVPATPVAKARRVMLMNAACIGGDEAGMDKAMAARLSALVSQLPPGAKVMVLAFDFTHDEDGRKREDLTTFSIANTYAAGIAKANPARFEWMASIHPYRDDAAEALAAAKAAGARGVKWLPPSMAIDLSHPKTRKFYDELRRHDVPLLVHLGDEQAAPGANRHEFGNPLLIRHALDRGVRVIAAHCASLGAGNFEAFSTLMAEPRYEGLLFGDISAITQANRAEVVPKILARREWHPRLLNGTDYPLPGIMPLFSVNGFVKAGLLEESKAAVIRDLRSVNPLLFDFVLKRSLGFPANIFETRPFFEATHVRA